MQLSMVNVFARREELLEALRSGEGLPELARRMAVGSFGCALLYGVVLGVQIGGMQVVSSPVKLPLILMGTGILCIASLYILLALAGARLSWLQVASLALCAIAASALAMVAALPLAGFWTYCFRGSRPAVTLIHSTAFLMAGVLGVRFGLQIGHALLPERRMVRVLTAWMVVYAFAAQQMAHLFRPYFHPTDVFMRPIDSGGTALETLVRILLG